MAGINGRNGNGVNGNAALLRRVLQSARAPAMANVNGNGKRVRRVAAFVATARTNTLDFMTDLRYGIMNYFNNPSAVIALLVVIALAYSHTIDEADGMLHNLAGRYPSNKLLGFLVGNLIKAIGCVAFIPAFIAMPKRSMPVIVMAGVVLCIVCLPEANIYQYLGLSLILHMYCHARIPSSRVAILIIFVVYVVVLHEMISKLPPLASLMSGDRGTVVTSTTVNTRPAVQVAQSPRV